MSETRIRMDGKTVGIIQGETYVTHRNIKRKHYMIKFRGFGISIRVLRVLKERHVKNVRIIYFGARGTRNYDASLDDYINSKLIYIDGFDEQKFVPVDNFIDSGILN